MDTLHAIHVRRSIRTHLDQLVPKELVQQILAIVTPVKSQLGDTIKSN